MCPNLLDLRNLFHICIVRPHRASKSISEILWWANGRSHMNVQKIFATQNPWVLNVWMGDFFLALRKNQNERSTQLACHLCVLLLFKMKPLKSSRWKNWRHRRVSGWKSPFSGSQRAGEGGFGAEEDALMVCMWCHYLHVYRSSA